MRECLEEGIIQGYADGELSLEMMEAAATHIASCASCAMAVREAEEESAIISSAFAPELSLSVPTARLRERLDAAIAELQPQRPLMRENAGTRLRAWLSALFAPLDFAPRQAVGFASLAVVAAFALIVIFAVVRQKNSGPEYALEAKRGASVDFTIPEVRVEETEVPDAVREAKDERIVAVRQTVKRARPRVQANREAPPAPLVADKNLPSKQPAPAKDSLLPGERSYLTAIASLTTNIEAGGEMALKPSLRAEYERNLAVVDQAIEVTRRAARSNPNDDEAATFLLATYQSKVDLLSTVADQARLSASAR